ncbi:hypothetical protein VB780_03255 [Leptolyngbya sp. CCNP1308]|uniref:hypothetical protein n=1 Tax=Leptolyngbya sp. CCNP1308 TaxID=3110255 RepID=UPI002B21AE69|nr:hypothetical protein [Leptolyngbya sp. CCNP1308]MEA5447571.1 hypothetical protein [Leptolyngbya sp. CCNP1308]
MTNILGTLADSAGAGLAGSLTARLVYNITDDSTIPDSIYLPVEVAFDITAGEVDIDLPESESYNVPYQFKFTIDGEDVPIIDFFAIVPNVGTVEFASLVPTGINNANLDTSALRVAKLIASDAELIVRIRPAQLFNVQAEGITTSTKWFINKPFTSGVLIRGLRILGLSGYADWTFRAGIINSSGIDVQLTVGSTPLDSEVNDRLFKHQVYTSSQPDTILGMYIEAVPAVDADALTASLTLEYTETA